MWEIDYQLYYRQRGDKLCKALKAMLRRSINVKIGGCLEETQLAVFEEEIAKETCPLLVLII